MLMMMTKMKIHMKRFLTMMVMKKTMVTSLLLLLMMVMTAIRAALTFTILLDDHDAH